MLGSGGGSDPVGRTFFENFADRSAGVSKSRRRREDLATGREPADRRVAAPADADEPVGRDDSLTVLFLCCHPALSPAAAVALTLRCVRGRTRYGGDRPRLFCI